MAQIPTTFPALYRVVMSSEPIDNIAQPDDRPQHTALEYGVQYAKEYPTMLTDFIEAIPKPQMSDLAKFNKLLEDQGISEDLEKTQKAFGTLQPRSPSCLASLANFWSC